MIRYETKQKDTKKSKRKRKETNTKQSETKVIDQYNENGSKTQTAGLRNVIL